ncbi:Cytochrome c-type biogenesis protein CcmE, heme chaperone [Caenispirillum salinarum AK4]|uniref:Cytochrome c-type biogenesis protein CcmE n=1 Tax=Caenispirillum salinarum AK4 TaxID=1238182 RepID=K9H1V3_9PROT|nr:cytochrome c maturation protein CcmE [Caenispirillum salinarum]EKV32220.1 Cytochrome c-type biogenesis protein CcmE, heme chaperone [Caenispirillum salinarum AK4]
MTRKKRRMYLIGAGMAMLFAAAGLVLTAFQDNLVFFYSPSDLQEKTVEADQRFRLGGMVEEGTVKKSGEMVRFNVTDYAASTPVVFSGILPDLFREGQGVVAEGTIGADGVFVAQEVLAKHDENYMPPEVADALAESDPDWKKKLGRTAEGVDPAQATN